MLNFDKVTVSWKFLNFYDNAKINDSFLKSWLFQRALPDYRAGLDFYVKQVLNISDPGVGRLNGFQYIPAMLSRFASPFDCFHVEPENDTTLFLGFEDMRVQDVYEIKSLKFHEMQSQLRQNTEKSANIIPAQEYSFFSLVHSQFPSCVQCTSDKYVFTQNLSGFAKYRNFFYSIVSHTASWKYNISIEDDISYVDISDIFMCSDVLWLQELVPLLKQDTPLWEQLFNMSNCVFHNETALSQIFHLYEVSSNTSRELSLSECGIVKNSKGVFPIVIF